VSLPPKTEGCLLALTGVAIAGRITRLELAGEASRRPRCAASADGSRRDQGGQKGPTRHPDDSGLAVARGMGEVGAWRGISRAAVLPDNPKKQQYLRDFRSRD
jgi:hypothetical protein